MTGAPILRTAADAALLFEPHFHGCASERLAVAHLDGERRLLHLSVEDGGSAQEVAMPVRAIIADAIRYRASVLVIGHCHPSGDPTPSAGDIAATRRLTEMTAGLGIRIDDHLVFGSDGCCSFREMGLL